ncbi:MAG: GNAT family N-acetyltransferase [Pseudomonadota bacterium]
MLQFEIINGPDLSDSDLVTFVKLVGQGGAVNEKFVKRGLKRIGAKAVFAKVNGSTVAVAALKVPLDSYRQGLEEAAKSGYPIPEKLYPFELGYVSVSPVYQRQGIAEKLVEQILNLSNNKGMFATTSNPGMKHKILPRLGFRAVGNTWENDQQVQLQLMVTDQSLRASD